MKTFWTTVFLATVLRGVALGQEGTAPPTATAPLNGPRIPATPAPSNPAPTSGLRIAPGSVIPVELTRSIDVKKLKIGDEVEAKVTQDLKANGELIVPKNTKVVGHVTEVETRNKEQKESQVGIAFDHAITKNGDSEPLAMSIQAIIAPPNSNPNNGNAGGEGVGQSTPGSGGAGMSGNNGARSAGMGVGAAPSPSPGSSAPGDETSTAQSSANAHQPINGNTQGVVGLSHLKLSMAANATQGSVISSEKGNVKLDSGTFMLLRVNQ